MARDTFTFKLDGDIELADLTRSLHLLTDFVQSLSKEIAKGTTIRWRLGDLKQGSAVAVVRGEVETAEVSDVPEKVVRGIGIVAVSLATGETIPYAQPVQEAAIALTRAIQGSITALHLLTDEVGDVVLTTPIQDEDERVLKAHTLGTIEGIVHTLQRREGYQFTLYDILLDRAVRCYFRQDQEALMREAWGKHVRVTGRIGRDPMTGRAVDIHDIWDVSIVSPAEPSAYKEALGVFKDLTTTPEVLVRQLRDDG